MYNIIDINIVSINHFTDCLIPKGWVVYAFMISTNLNENFHNEALTFNPWRLQLDQVGSYL